MAASDVTMRSKTETRTVTSASGPPSSPIRQSSDLSYMHRPPTILPNYGKKYKGGLKLKTNVPRVLLYDNVTQQTMLDVQLSGIKNQRYKTGRELEMHMKSFLLRKQHKDKALAKLTRVDHGEDYSEFEQQYFGHSMEDIRYQEEGEGHQRLSLPSIHSNNGIGGMSKARRARKRKLVQRSRSLNGFSNGGHHFHQGLQNHSQGHSENNSALPRLVNDSQRSPSSIKGEGHVGPTHQFEPRRRVGFRIEKSPAGVTRIFHAIPSADEQSIKTTAENGQVSTEKNAEINVIQDVNKPPEVIVTVETETSGPALDPHPEANDLPHSASVMSGDSRFGRGRTVNKNTPVFDQRFEQLQQALVRQDPPNEGFTELSPSFVRQYPLHHVGERLAYLRVGERKAALTEIDRHSLYSEGVSPVLSDGNHSDDFDDERESLESYSRANSALKRLG